MKRILSFLLVIFPMFMGYRHLHAQQFYAGIKGGPSFTSLQADDGVAKYQSAVGFHVAGFAVYKVSALSYATELQYSMQGGKVKAYGEYMRTYAQYLNIPLLIRYEFIPGVSVHGGPQIGFLMCMKSDYHPVTKEPYDQQTYTKAYKKTDFGLALGAGYESGKWVFDARYYLGLANIADYEGLPETKNRVMSASVGYKLFIK